MHHLASVTWNWCTWATHTNTHEERSHMQKSDFTPVHIFVQVSSRACTYGSSAAQRKIISHLWFFPNSALLISVHSLHQLLPYSLNNICKLRFSCSLTPQLPPPSSHTCTHAHRHAEYTSDQVSPLTCTYTCLESPTSFPFLSPPNPPLLLPFHL